jgi:hypothetical protein
MTFWRRIPPVTRRSLFRSNATSANPIRSAPEPGTSSEELQQPGHVTPRLLSSFLLERQSRNASADVKEKSTLRAENTLSSHFVEVSANDPIVKPKASKKKRKPVRRGTNELATPVKLPDVPTDKKKVKNSSKPATEKRKKRLNASISKEESIKEDPHEEPPHQKRPNYCLPLPYIQRIEGFLVPTTRPSLQGHRYFCTLNYSDLGHTDLHPGHPQRDIAKLSHGLDRVLFKYATLCPVADFH